MAYSVELVGSREATGGPSPSIVLRYLIVGTDDDALVRALTNAASPVTYGSLVKSQIHTSEEGEEFWHGDVQYSQRKQGNPGDIEWAFEMSAAPATHLSTSLETVAKYPATAPDFKQFLNVRKDGNDLTPDGLDADVATSLTWSETHYLTFASFTPAYIAKLYALRGRVNDDAWRVYAKGEVRLLSVSGSPKGEYVVPLTFRFEAIPNETNIVIGAVTVTAKEGHEYLWVYGEMKEDATAKCKVIQPQGAYVEKIYEYGDFSSIGLPDPWA